MLEQIVKKLTSKTVNKLTAKKPDEDFIPYVCHYDKETILTKNGELLQTIRITGLSDNTVASDLISLRDSIRDAIYDNVKESGFAFWFHTIRRKKSVVATNENGFSDYLSSQINESWIKENKFENQFINELYITIISEGLENSITDINGIAKSFSYKSTQEIHKNHLANSIKRLKEITEKIFAETRDHGAKILGIKNWEGVLYSEPMRFFGKIINLYEERYPLSVNDISSDLASHKIAFGGREVEVLGHENKNFATILSVKEYHEVSVGSLDKILNLPFEFIITQSFNFFYDKKDLEVYQYNNHILEISQDNDFRDLAGFTNFIESDSGAKNDFGKTQNTIMIIANSQEEMEKDVALAIEKFSALGFILVREDIFSEHCFWAQLPANFSFLRRQKLINTLRVPGFAALHSFPSGSMYGNHWGSAVTTLKTIINTPYFFNFHEQNLGHTLIFGPKSSGKTTLTNFLLSQARKFNNKIFYFDFDQSSKCFIEALSGKNYKLTKDIEDKEFLQMNPFLLAPTEENATFLTNWIKQLVLFLKGNIDEEELRHVNETIRRVLTIKSANFLVAFDALRSEKTKNVYEKLKIWGNGKLSYIFGSQNEIDWKNQVIGFNLSEIINQKPILIPVISYLFYKIETALDGTPTIIVIDEAFEFLDNPIIQETFDAFLKRMRQKNCMIIFNSQNHHYISESKIAQTIHENVATEIYLPDEDLQEYYHDIFKLSEEEIDVLRFMAQEKNYHALIKHTNESVIVEANFSSFKDLLPILSCDELTITSMEEIISMETEQNKGLRPLPQNWIPQLIEILQEIKKEQEQLRVKQIAEKLKAISKENSQEETQEVAVQNQEEDSENFEIQEPQENLEEDNYV